MANIKLKNASGVETTYNDVTTIKIPKADGSGNVSFFDASAYTIVSSETEMDKLLKMQNLGKYYLYTGQTVLRKYANNCLYKVIMQNNSELAFDGHVEYPPLDARVTYGEGMYGNIYYCGMPYVEGSDERLYYSSRKCQFYAIDGNGNEFYLGEECVY